MINPSSKTQIIISALLSGQFKSIKEMAKHLATKDPSLSYMGLIRLSTTIIRLVVRQSSKAVYKRWLNYSWNKENFLLTLKQKEVQNLTPQGLANPNTIIKKTIIPL